MDESTLRNYFRKVLGVAPGASRRELRNCRDKRAQFWRAAIVAPQLDAFPRPTEGQAQADTAEGRLSVTNTAYDCLSNADKFSDFQARLAAGDCFVSDLDTMLLILGESNLKPPAARVLAKRQAQLQERMDRVIVLCTESVKKAGHDEALIRNTGKLADPDRFYDSVYRAALGAGNRTCDEELAQMGAANMEVDDTFKSDLEEIVVDQAEMIAHKEYDRLEDRAARSTPTPTRPRYVALVLSLIIMGLVVGTCFFGATSQPTPLPVGQVPLATNTNTAPVIGTAGGAAVVPPAPATSAIPAAPAAGIANSVFNRSVFGAPNSTVTDATTNQVNSGAPPAVAPPPVVNPVSAAEVKEAEIASADALAAVPAADIGASPLVANAGTAGLAGYSTGGSKAGASLYASGIDSAMKTLYPQSVRDFTEAYAAGHAKEALYNQGVVLAILGQYQPALDIFNQVLAVSPMPQALYNRALCHQLLALDALKIKNNAEWARHLNLALKSYALAVKAEPRMSQAYYNRGLICHDLGQLENASIDFGKASALPVFMQAAGYNRDVIDLALKKRTTPPIGPAPPPPVGPVGPAGPSGSAAESGAGSKP